jgi:cytochrome b561
MQNKGRAARLLRNWREDYIGQTFLSAAASLGVTTLFALYHGYLGLCYASVWHGSIGVFYLLLMVIRGTILLTEKRNKLRVASAQGRCRRRAFLISSLLLLVMDGALIWPIAMMVVLDKPVSMGLTPAIAMAAYTTWKITMASVHMGRQRHRAGGNILVAELRTVSFIDALVSILTLQNTLIMVNRTAGDENSMLPLSAASSAVIYVVIVSITVRMLGKGLKPAGIRTCGKQT